MTVHEKLRPYECDVCSKKLASPSSLSRHKKVIHNVISNKNNGDVNIQQPHQWWCCGGSKETKSDEEIVV